MKMNTSLSKKSLAVIVAAMALAFGPSHMQAARSLGVDVSSFQGSGVNWTSVKASGITFAWAKATEGISITDADFTINASHGKSAGVYMGAYHFAHPASASPASEENHFWSVAGGYITADGKTLMPMLDMEVFTGVTGASSYSDWANQWCDDAVADATANNVHIKPAIYTSACSACNFNSSVSQWSSDIADYNGQSAQTGTPWSTCGSCAVWGSGVWTFWQYTDSGAVSGISGGVDSDVFNGTTATLIATEVASAFSSPAKTGAFHTTDGTWHLRNTLNGGTSDIIFAFGLGTDLPVIGDWNGVGGATCGVFRPSDGTWHLRNSNSAGASDYAFQFGQNGDLPVAGDWDGDGKTSIGIFRPSDGTWHLRNALSTGASDYVFQFGQNGDLPVTGDWDGNGKTSIGIFRPSDGTWHLRNALSTGASDYAFQFGQNGDVPITGDWNGNGTTSIGIFRASDGGNWHLRNALSSGSSDYIFPFGDGSFQPTPWW